MKKSILYISYDGLTDPLGQSQVLPYLIGLSQNYKIHILSSEKPNNFKKQKDIIQDICDRNNLSWNPIKYHKKPPVFSSIYDFYQLKKIANKLIHKNNISLIHSRSYIPALVGLDLKRKNNVKLLFDMRGFWADERKDAGLWDTKNLVFKTIYNFFKSKEIEFFTNSDHIVSLTNEGKKEIHSWELTNQKPISVIPCCADFNHFNFDNYTTKEIQDEKIELGFQPDDYIISYLGSIGTWYNLNEMLNFFRHLKLKKQNAKFLFITKEDENVIKNKALELGLNSNDIKVQSANRSEVPKKLAVSDVSIFFINPYYSKKASSPTKQAEIMGMGVPLICNAGVGDVDEIVNKTKSGLIVKEYTESEYIKVIENLDALEIKEKSTIRHEGEKIFSLEDGVNAYKRIYKKLLN